MRLDKTRNHAEVYGLPGVKWEQDGSFFRHDGSMVDEPKRNEPDPWVLVVSEPTTESLEPMPDLEVPNPFVCHLCSRVLKSNAGLSAHMRSHK
jgi:hypothetical protein